MRTTLFSLAFCALATTAQAGNLEIKVLDKEGKLVPDAVVMLYPSKTGAAPVLLPTQATIRQEKFRFIPELTVLATGSKVVFINHDSVDHHLRATPAGLSQAPTTVKQGFELRLDGRLEGKASSAAEVTLDAVGALLLSCHIHGSMRGHVYVADTPWTLKTEADGIAKFAGLPDGPLQLKVWHSDQLLELPRQVVQVGSSNAPITLQLSVVPRRKRI